MRMLTEDVIADLIDLVKNECVFSSTGIRHIRTVNRKTFHPPLISYKFLPLSNPVLVTISRSLRPSTTKYPEGGIVQEEMAELTCVANDSPSTGYIGRQIAGTMVNELKNFVYYRWPVYLRDHRAHIRKSSLTITDESDFTYGENLAAYVLRFTIISETNWQYTPYGGTTDETEVSRIVTNADDQKQQNNIRIQVDV